MDETEPTLTVTDRSTVRREAERASYDRVQAYAVLDAGRIAHVGIVDGGQPFVLPMAYGRDGDRLLLHGARASRLARALAAGVPACATVTLLDGMVLARSAFHHSMNYRSVVALGVATEVRGDEEQRRAFDVLVDHLVPGRSAEVRPMTRLEHRQTMILELPIDEATVKVRTGGALDDPADLGLPVWAGLVPLHTVAGEPIVEADVPADAPAPAAFAAWGLVGPGR